MSSESVRVKLQIRNKAIWTAPACSEIKYTPVGDPQIRGSRKENWKLAGRTEHKAHTQATKWRVARGRRDAWCLVGVKGDRCRYGGRGHATLISLLEVKRPHRRTGAMCLRGCEPQPLSLGQRVGVCAGTRSYAEEMPAGKEDRLGRPVRSGQQRKRVPASLWWRPEGWQPRAPVVKRLCPSPPRPVQAQSLCTPPRISGLRPQAPVACFLIKK